MKKCVSCNIYVSGEGRQCPICQNGLTGEGTPYNWPSIRKLRLQSIFYRIQLFVVLALTFVSLVLDFLLDVNTGMHWSLSVALWAISLEWLIRYFIKKNVVIAAIITYTAIHISLLLILTGWYMGFLMPVVKYVVPIVVSVLLIVNLILSLLDKHGNALIYLLANIIIAIVPYVPLYISKVEVPLLWTICLMISVITFIGICVFRGRSVLNEIEKRMSL